MLEAVFSECTSVSGALQARPLPQFAFVALILMQLSMLVAFLLPGFGQFEPAKPLDRGNARCANESAANKLLFVARHEHLAVVFDGSRSHGCGDQAFHCDRSVININAVCMSQTDSPRHIRALTVMRSSWRCCARSWVDFANDAQVTPPGGDRKITRLRSRAHALAMGST